MIPADETESMSTSMRPAAPVRLHPERQTVEDLVGRIADLVLTRQELRATASSRDALEGNRSELVAAHWELSRALIERHYRPAA